MLEVITDFRVLMQYARELGEAKKQGDPKQIEVAQKKHDAYRDICLGSDTMSLGHTVGSLSDIIKGNNIKRKEGDI